MIMKKGIVMILMTVLVLLSSVSSIQDSVHLSIADKPIQNDPGDPVGI